jgi:hypothetical protein
MWWTYIVVPALLAVGIYGFVLIVRVNTQRMTSETDRRAEDLYDEFADSPHRRHRQP